MRNELAPLLSCIDIEELNIYKAKISAQKINYSSVGCRRNFLSKLTFISFLPLGIMITGCSLCISSNGTGMKEGASLELLLSLDLPRLT